MGHNLLAYLSDYENVSRQGNKMCIRDSSIRGCREPDRIPAETAIKTGTAAAGEKDRDQEDFL